MESADAIHPGGVGSVFGGRLSSWSAVCGRICVEALLALLENEL